MRRAVFLSGIPVTLYEKTPTGERDPFNREIFEETPVTVENVLVYPAGSQAQQDALRLYGKRIAYTLAIPMGDAHVWEDRRVAFFGQEFRTVGFCQEGIERMLPLEWNKQISCERVS